MSPVVGSVDANSCNGMQYNAFHIRREAVNVNKRVLIVGALAGQGREMGCLLPRRNWSSAPGPGVSRPFTLGGPQPSAPACSPFFPAPLSRPASARLSWLACRWLAPGRRCPAPTAVLGVLLAPWTFKSRNVM